MVRFKLGEYKEVAYTIVGAAAGGMVEATGIIDYALEKVGANYTWDIKDAQGTWIWGWSLAEPIDLLIGLLVTVYGKKKANTFLTRFGTGYMCGVLGTKLGELYPYFWKQLHPLALRSSARLPAQVPLMAARYDIAPAKKGTYR